MKNRVFLAVAVGLTVFGVAACAPAASEAGSDTGASVSQKKAADKPKLTTAQKNAVGKAKDYLRFSGFSKIGLVKQLKFEGFSGKDATFAANELGSAKVWNKEAADKAKEYMDTQSFSKEGLRKQLKFEGFTTAQIAHGLSAVGY